MKAWLIGVVLGGTFAALPAWAQSAPPALVVDPAPAPVVEPAPAPIAPSASVVEPVPVAEPVPAPVIAQAPAPVAPTPHAVLQNNDTPLRRRWYGWQTFAVDGAAIGLGAAAAATDSRGIPTVALSYGVVATYALGGPVVHLLHHQPLKAAGSLGLRVGVPALTGALIWLGTGGSCHQRYEYDDETCLERLAQILIGVTVAAAVGSIVDGTVLAQEPVEPKPRVSVMPTLGWDGARGGRLGLQGVF